MREATAAEIARWDELVAANPDHGEILQTKAWGEFKGRFDWKPKYIIATVGKIQLAVLMTTRKTVFGEVWYSPKGPGVWTAEQLAEFTAKLQTSHFAPFVVKLEPELWESDITPAQRKAAGLVKAPFDVHLSRATIRIKLDRDEEAIMGAFRQKTRYNVRYAAKNGVNVEPVEANPANLEIMYKLKVATQKRAGYYLRPREYFLGYWQGLLNTGQAQLFFAKHEGEVLAAAFVTYMGPNSWYKDGASSGNKRNLQAPYLLQWEIMKWLKAKGVKHYDLVGIPRVGQRDASHPFYGLYQFKSGFGGEEIQFIGTYDLPLVGWKYKLWRLFGERLTLAYASRVNRELWY
jgi:lipid II:glycine glycyltransferase (peptidoglycan interpeptide bridge formation enzyme)